MKRSTGSGRASEHPADSIKRLRVTPQHLSNHNCPSSKTSQMDWTSAEEEKIKTFMSFTEATRDAAINALRIAAWKTDFAVDLYFQNPSQFQIITGRMDSNKLKTLFNKYANDAKDTVGKDRIGPNGLLRLLTDMKLDALDRRALILACKLKAQTQCEFSWDEWITGLTAMNVETIQSLRKKLDDLDSALTNQNAFREIYQFVFDYGKQAGQRSMDLEYALQYWRILFKDQFPLWNVWEEFLRNEDCKGITKDTWTLLLDFCFTIQPDLSNYDDDGAWPLLLDQFVAYARSKQNQMAA